MLPRPVAAQLKLGKRRVAQHYEQVTILYSDIKGFTSYSAASTPASVVKLLSGLFSAFDKLTAKHGVYKIQTIGDAYVLVAGLPFNAVSHLALLAEEDRSGFLLPSFLRSFFVGLLACLFACLLVSFVREFVSWVVCLFDCLLVCSFCVVYFSVCSLVRFLFSCLFVWLFVSSPVACIERGGCRYARVYFRSPCVVTVG